MAIPKYDQIAGDLRGRIVRGELSPGDALPSERELTERWNVARATVVRALDVLRHEGLIETRQGTGSVVRERTPLARTAGERYSTAVETGNIYTAGEHAEILSRTSSRHRTRWPQPLACSPAIRSAAATV